MVSTVFRYHIIAKEVAAGFRGEIATVAICKISIGGPVFVQLKLSYPMKLIWTVVFEWVHPVFFDVRELSETPRKRIAEVSFQDTPVFFQVKFNTITPAAPRKHLSGRSFLVK